MGFKYIGDSNQLLFQFESGTYAIASGARQWIGLVQEHASTQGVGVTPVRYQGVYSRNVGIFTDGKLEYGGTFTYYPQDWKFLGFAVGSTYNGAAGSHLMRETNSDSNNYAISGQTLSSFTLEDAKKTAATGSNFIRTFKGCMVDSLKLTATEGEIISVEVGYKAQNSVYSSGAVTAIAGTGARTTKPYMWSDTVVQLPSGASLANCTEFNLTLNNNLETRFPLNGSRTIETVIPLNRDYEVAATFLMDSDNANTLYNTYYIQGGSFNGMVVMKATAGSCFIIMSGCRITDMAVPSPVEGLTEQSCTIMPTSIAVDVYDSIGSYNGW